MGLNTSQLRDVWDPPCNSSGFVTITLHGGGRVTVDPRMVEAVNRLNDILVDWDYRTRASDTGAYNCRQITGGSGYSLHAYGIALDLNWSSNPYGPNLITDMPQGMVDAITGLRTNNGCRVWEWGGSWSNNKDAMHYEADCSPADLATGIQGGVKPLPEIGKDQMFALIRYDGKVYRWNGVHRVLVPNEQMLGGDQIMLTVLEMDSTIWDVDPWWASTYPEVTDSQVYWNTSIIAQHTPGVPPEHIA